MPFLKEVTALVEALELDKKDSQVAPVPQNQSSKTVVGALAELVIKQQQELNALNANAIEISSPIPNNSELNTKFKEQQRKFEELLRQHAVSLENYAYLERLYDGLVDTNQKLKQEIASLRSEKSIPNNQVGFFNDRSNNNANASLQSHNGNISTTPPTGSKIEASKPQVSTSQQSKIKPVGLVNVLRCFDVVLGSLNEKVFCGVVLTFQDSAAVRQFMNTFEEKHPNGRRASIRPLCHHDCSNAVSIVPMRREFAFKISEITETGPLLMEELNNYVDIAGIPSGEMRGKAITLDETPQIDRKQQLGK